MKRDQETEKSEDLDEAPPLSGQLAFLHDARQLVQEGVEAEGLMKRSVRELARYVDQMLFTLIQQRHGQSTCA
jgi:hypothetical protein